MTLTGSLIAAEGNAFVSFFSQSRAFGDLFDALTADRPYRASMPLEKALGIIRAELGAAFDPAAFAALERTLTAIEGDLARAA